MGRIGPQTETSPHLYMPKAIEPRAIEPKAVEPKAAEPKPDLTSIIEKITKEAE